MAHWRREWQTTSAFLPQEAYEQYEKAKDMTLEDKPPGLVGVQYATREEQRNSSRKKMMCLVVKVKSNAVKIVISYK